MRFLSSASILTIALICSTAVHAQETTSSIRGVVTAAGAPVSNASVTVTHVPSGTSSTVTTNADGSFNAQGLRIGGPFSVSVVAGGYSESTVTDIQLTAGQPLRLPISIEKSQDIVVTASRSRSTELSPGPITALGREAIEGVATVNRDVRDIARRSPFATLDATNGRGVEIAGQNGRLNLFTVDGIRFSDNFGLNTGGLPTARGPVPLDAIEQLSVKIAPYDISEGNFQGGSINVVLRSGGNRFHGSGFYSYTSDQITGDKTRDRKVTLDYKSKNYGGFLSGPIIKDKLFFAFAYEKLNETQPIDIGLTGSANPIPGLTQAVVDSVKSITNGAYGYDAMDVFSASKEGDEKYTAKIDWNIVDGQRATVSYIHNKGTVGLANNNNTVPASPTIGLRSIAYQQTQELDAGTVQLNSDWSDRFTTEVRGFYRKNSILVPNYGGAFSQFQVCTDPTNPLTGAGNALITCSQGSSASPGAARIYLGRGQFQAANLVKVKTYGGDASAKLTAGDHTLKATFGYQAIDVTNIFIRDALGTYYFDSISDYQNKSASLLNLQGAITGNNADIYASFKYANYTFGLQDSWDITPGLNVQIGGRYDLYASNSLPPLNAAFVQRNGFSNLGTINGKAVFQPRFGFTWQAADRLTFKGGAGKFSGGSPDVLLGNSFSQAGALGNAIGIQRTPTGCIDTSTRAALSAALCSAALDNVSGKGINPAVTDYLRSNTASLALSSSNAQDPNYKLQATWKFSLSADYSADLSGMAGFLGDGWNFGVDLYYGKTINAPSYRDLRAVQVGTLPDGRPRYSTDAGANTDLLLYNVHGGRSLIGVARWDKRFGDLAVGASYTYQDITDVNSLNNGTTASGIYQNNAVRDPNLSTLGTSNYQIRNSFKFNLDYSHAFFGDYKTRISIFGERRSGRVYSLTMNDPSQTNGRSSVFGVASPTNRFLLYVPNVASITADSLVSYDSVGTFTALQAFIQSNGLDKYQGRIIPRNTERSPAYFKVDAHVEQEVPTSLGSSRIALFADVENLLNFVDKDWGSLRQTNLSSQQLSTVVNVACATTAGNSCTQYRYSSYTDPAIINQARFSLWSIRLGAKFKF